MTITVPEVFVQWVPGMLMLEQKFTWKVTSREIMALSDEDPEEFLRRNVTQDKTWVPHFDPEMKMESKLRRHCSPPCSRS